MNPVALDAHVSSLPASAERKTRVEQVEERLRPPSRREDSVQFSQDTKTASGRELSDSEARKVEKLERRDQEVRVHEQQHKSSAGLAGGGIQYDYEVGPDGRTYAVGGKVKVDLSKEATPEATLQKAKQIRRAALAPADPSLKDREAASKANRLEAEARRELEFERREEAGLPTPAVQPDGRRGGSGNGENQERLSPAGEVPNVIESGRTPQETIEKAQQIKRAALYGGEVSSSDRLAAAAARRMEAEARREVLEERQDRISSPEPAASPEANKTEIKNDSPDSPQINLLA